MEVLEMRLRERGTETEVSFFAKFLMRKTLESQMFDQDNT